MSAVDKLQVLRVIDKIDRIGAEGCFDQLTTGWTGPDGARVPGVGLSNAQAAVMVGFVCSGRNRLIEDRFSIMTALEEKIIDAETGETGWGRLLSMPARADQTWADGGRPANIAWALDDMAFVIRRTSQ